MPKFRSFWFGESLPLYQQLAMKSFINFGHEFVLFTYRHFDVPAGVELLCMVSGDEDRAES